VTQNVEPMPSLEDARQVLAAQPFSALVGAQLVEFGDGRAVLEVPVKADLLQQFGFVHGGVVAYAADNALTIAGGTVLGAQIVTRGFSIEYLRPARGELLRAVATVVDESRRQALCRCDIYAVEGGVERRCAAAQGAVARIDLQR
jgi:uncharacterized protein (TIGR00369 family)